MQLLLQRVDSKADRLVVGEEVGAFLEFSYMKFSKGLGANEELVTDYLWELQANLHEVAAQKEEIARKRTEMM